MSGWPTPDFDPPEHVFSINISDSGALDWWTSDGVWRAVQAVGIALLATLGVVINVLCALIWSGRPALRSHSTRYVYNMLAANLLCAGLLAPLDVAALLLQPPQPAAPDAADLLWSGTAVAAAAAAASDAQVTVAEGAGVAAAAALVAQPSFWSRPWSLWLRDVNRFAEALAVQVSVFSVLLVALDRHRAVLSPLHYHRMATRQRSTILIVSNWLLTPAITALFEARLIPYSQWIHFGIGFAVPLYIIVYMYVQMSLAAHQNSKRTRRHSVCTSTQSNNGNSGQMSLDAGSRAGSRGGSLDLSLPPFTGTPEHANKGDFPRRPGRNPPLGSIVMNSKRRCSNASFSTLLLREEGRAVKTAIFVVGAYLACWTPYFVFVVLQRPSPPCVVMLAHVNACVSPWIYVLRNEEVRLEAKKLVARVLHLKVARQPQDSPGHSHGQSHGRSDSCYSKSMEASTHPAHPLRQQSSHYDSMSVQSFHMPTAGGVGSDLANPLAPQGLSGYHATALGPLGPLGASSTAAGTDSPLTADSLCSAAESPGPMGPAVRVAYKHPSQYPQYTQYTQYSGHLQRGRSQTCIRQNSDSSSGSGRPLLQSDQLQQTQGRCGGGRRRLGSSGDSGSDQDTPRQDDPSPPPPLTPPDRPDRAASRRKLLHRDSLEEEDEDQLSPTYTQPPALAALRRLSVHGHAPPPTPPRRSSLCGSATRRSSLKLDGNIFQFDNIPMAVSADCGGGRVDSSLLTLSLRQNSAGSVEMADSSAVSGDSGIFIGHIGLVGHVAGGEGECPVGPVLRPPPPPRNKLKRIEAVEESVCDTAFCTSTTANGPVSPPTQPEEPEGPEGPHSPFQFWARGEFHAAPPMLSMPPMPPMPPMSQTQQCGRAVNKMADIRNLVKTTLHRPAFRIPKADF